MRKRLVRLCAGLALGLGITARIAEAAQAQTGTIPIDLVASATLALSAGPAALTALANIVAITRVGLSGDEQAMRVEILDRHDIEPAMLRAPGNVMSVLDEISGSRVQITSPELGLADLRVEGLRGQYTRLLSDGVPLYFDLPGGLALPQISPLDLGRVEVLENGASALFGANAISVVNLVSRRPGTEREREILFSQSTEGGTDAALSMVLPPSGHWSSTWLVGGHMQQERDVDGDGWSDIAGYRRAVVHPRVFWNNGKGKSAFGTANVVFEKREGGSVFAHQELESRSADGMLGGQMPFHGATLQGAATLYAQSRIRKFSDAGEHERREGSTIEIELRGKTPRQTWVAGLAEDWFTIRSKDPLWSKYTAPRTGLFVHDDVRVTPWLLVSGSARVDHRVTVPITFSPHGSVRVRSGAWTAGFSADRSYFEPTAITEETEAAGTLRLTVIGPHLDVENIRSVSADLAHETRTTAVRFTVFQSHIDHPVLVDRATFTLRADDQPVLTHGVEILGRVQRAPFAVTGAYTYLQATEAGGREVALTPRHSVDVIAMMEKEGRGRAGVQISFTGAQRLDANPYRSTSAPYTVITLFGDRRIGRWSLFANASNLSNVRQTDWDPIALPSRNAVDGRFTVDAWAPLAGRVINFGVRIAF